MSGGRFETIDNQTFWLEGFLLDNSDIGIPYLLGSLTSKSYFIDFEKSFIFYDNTVHTLNSFSSINKVFNFKKVWFQYYDDFPHLIPYNGLYIPDVVGKLFIKLDDDKVVFCNLINSESLKKKEEGLYIKLENCTGFVSFDTLNDLAQINVRKTKNVKSISLS